MNNNNVDRSTPTTFYYNYGFNPDCGNKLNEAMKKNPDKKVEVICDRLTPYEIHQLNSKRFDTEHFKSVTYQRVDHPISLLSQKDVTKVSSHGTGVHIHNGKDRENAYLS